MKTSLIIVFLFFTCTIQAQQTNYVDFKKANAEIFTIDPVNQEIGGHIELHFDILADTDSIFVDAKDFKFSEISLNDHQVSNQEYDGKHIIVKENFKANTSHVLHISWLTRPKKAIYFLGWNNEAPNQIWTQGQGKYTSHWMPSIDDMNDKIEFDLTVKFDKDYHVIANGKLIKLEKGEVSNIWYYDMQQPMSSYLVAIAIGKYDKKETVSNSGVLLEMYYYPQDSLKFEPTYRYTRKIFDFLENEIGVPYPWQNYKEVPIYDFLYAGMENTSTTLFSDRYLVDDIEFNDNNYINIDAHEMAHQWFGDLITETSGAHHWLHEGFATYYALLAEKMLFGNDHFYWKLYESAQQLEAQDRQGKSTTLLDPKSSSLTFYQKGAWTLFMLRELIGTEIFRNSIIAYLEQFEYQNVSTRDFLGIVEAMSGQDLTLFADEWLHSANFPIERAMDALKQNSMFIQEYLMVDCELKSSKCSEYLNSGISDEAKVKIISQIPNEINSEVFKSSIKVRQAIAIHLKEIPDHLKENYESLLQDSSYLTIENALFNLWNNFPEERIKYLSKTKNIQGFNNKNVRLLWLLLASVTPEYGKEQVDLFIDELNNYTSPRYNFEIRMTAFQYLKLIGSCNDACLKNLVQAKGHHNWQMVKFAKDMLDSTKN